MSRTYTTAQRSEAMAFYAEHGPAEASRRTGIPGATIASWARRSGTAHVASENCRARVEGAKLRWAERRTQLADQAGDAAERALAIAIAALENGNEQLAKAAGVVFGITVDKAQLLTGDVTSRMETVVSDDGDALRTRAVELDELARRRLSHRSA